MNKKKNIFNFPNLLNNGTILVLLAAYIVVLLCVIVLLIPKNNYTAVPEYSHTTSNPDVSSYLKVSTSLISDKNGKVEPKQTVTIFINDNKINQEDEVTRVAYEVSGLTKSKTMNYMYSGSRNNYSNAPVTHTLISDKVVSGGNYEKLFGKIVYETSKDEIVLSKNEYSFAETILQLSKKEKNSEISTTKVLKDVLSISVSANKSSDADYYSVSTNVNIDVLTSIYHLDYQSWIVTENGDVYPVVGFYNVYYSKKPTLTSTNKISTNLNPKYIIVKAIITNSFGNTQYFFYKDSFENIVR